MLNPASLRDSTQIVLPSQSLNGLREQVTTEFTVSVVDGDDWCRIHPRAKARGFLLDSP